jgi:hypothetical protein
MTETETLVRFLNGADGVVRHFGTPADATEASVLLDAVHHLDESLITLHDDICIGSLDRGRCGDCGRMVIPHRKRGCAMAIPVVGQVLWLADNRYSIPFVGKWLWLRRKSSAVVGPDTPRPPSTVEPASRRPQTPSGPA